MTPEQIQQLLTEAEQVTAKMREALAKMETPAQWTPKKGDWAEVKVDGFCYSKGDIIQIDENCNIAPYCIFNSGERWAVAINKLRHLPDYQPKPKLATTYEEVVAAVKPTWVCCADGSFVKARIKPFYIPNEQAAKQDRAFIQIKNLEAYCAGKFEGERRYVINISFSGSLIKYPSNHAPFHFSKEAADFVMEHFPEVFKIYYGVK